MLYEPLKSQFDSDDSMIITNLDNFFHDLYTYHRYHGHVPFVMRTIRKLFISTCGIGLFFFLTLVIDWSSFFLCGGGHAAPLTPLACRNGNGNGSRNGNENGSGDVNVSGNGNDNDSESWGMNDGGVIDSCEKIIRNFSSVGSGVNWFIIVLNILFLLHLLYLVFRSIRKFKMAYRMNRFYENVLKISELEIKKGITWDQVVSVSISRQRSGLVPNILKQLSAPLVSSYLNRDDNFLTTIVKSSMMKNILGGIEFCQPLIWIIRRFIIKNLSIEKKSIKNVEFLSIGDERLKTIFNRLFLLSIFLTPILLVRHVSMEFFLVVQRFTSRGMISSNSNNINYKWSNHAKIILRKYNEDEHSCNIRLGKFSLLVTEMMNCYPDYFTKEIVHILTFLFTSIVGIIIVFTLNDRSMLFNIKIGDQALIVILTILSPVAYICSNYLKGFSHSKISSTQRNQILLELSNQGLIDESFTSESFTSESKTNTNDDNGRLFESIQQVKKYHCHKMKLFLNEFIGILFLPRTLFKIAKNDKSITHHLNKITQVDENIGVICRQPRSPPSIDRTNQIDFPENVAVLFI
jgi:hypothetical protein